MLTTFRHYSQHIIVKTILGVLVLAFILWGVGDVLRAGGASDVATIGDRTVSIQQFDRMFRQQASQVPNADRANLARTLLNTMINRELLLAYADELGLDIGEQPIANQIKRYPSFLNDEGVFDYDLFITRINGAGMNEEMFLESERENMIMDFVLNSLRSSVHVPNAMATALYYVRNEQRAVEVLAIPKDHAKNVPDPTEAELVDFYEEKREDFTAPEYRSFHYAIADCRAMEPLTLISDADLEEAYEERKLQGLYDQPETRDVKQLFFIDKDKALAGYKPIEEGGRFEDAFALMDPSHKNMNLDMNGATRDAIPPSLANVIFSLEEGAISKPVEGPLGWHIFKVEKITPDGSRSFADVKDSLHKELNQQKTCKQVQEDFIAMEDAFAGGNSLQDVAKDYPYLSITSINDVAKDATGQNGQPVQELPVYSLDGSDSTQHFLGQVFNADPGGDAFTFGPSQGTYIALQVTKSIPPRERALDEIKGLVISAWHKQKQAEESKRLAQTAAKHIGGGKNIHEVANAMGVKVEERTIERPVPRYVFDENALPISLRNDAFSKEIGAVTNVYEDPRKNTFYVAQVKSIIAPENAGNANVAPRLDSVKNQLREEMVDDLLKQFTKSLGDRYTITINDALLARYIEG